VGNKAKAFGLSISLPDDAWQTHLTPDLLSDIPWFSPVLAIVVRQTDSFASLEQVNPRADVSALICCDTI